jgi:polar amino acid transport system substrate-binding protein
MIRASRSRAAVVLVAGLAAALAGCSSSSGAGSVSAVIEAGGQKAATAQLGAPAAQAAQAAVASTCSPPANASYPTLGSLPAAGSLPSGSLEATIRQRGYLLVGVSGDTKLLGARDLLADGRPLQGFDIDVAKAIGAAIGVSVRFKVITTADRFSQVNAGAENGGVDLVARAVSMTCDRWANADPAKGSAFSAAYLTSAQRVLANPKVYPTVDALIKANPKAKICAPSGTTSLANVAKIGPEVIAVPVAIHSDCLALWQEGRVDAITGDDVILAGFRAQDPTADILTGGPDLGSTPYGLALPRNRAFVQYVNTVMASSAFQTAWNTAYQTYLAQPLTKSPKSFPTPDYSRS